MAALLKFRPWHGATTAAETIARLIRAVEPTQSRQTIGRPMLVCHWQQDDGGRLSCFWGIEPPDTLVPPH
jgi:hypothetical protein